MWRGLLFVGALVFVLLVLAAIDLLRIRADVESAQEQLASLGAANGSTQFRDVADRSAARLQRADTRAHDSIWLKMLAPVPIIGDQIRGVRVLAQAGRQIGDLADEAARQVQVASEQAAGSPAARVDLMDVALTQIDRLEHGLSSIH